ncbi:MAG TPA: sigma-70 family RNA polymerase sigma factor [Actinomycetota bacterium]|nr:sigma-70 family RNA polymerase sigma factor [Actinomycetota bacterium]
MVVGLLASLVAVPHAADVAPPDARPDVIVRELPGRAMHHGGVEPTVVPDAALASLAQAGDVEALAAPLERHRPSLYAAAVGLLDNRADALDAVQDTFVVARLRLADLRDADAARAWLHAVLRNNCRMRIRQRREIPFAGVEPPDAVPGPEETLEQQLMGEWVWHALDRWSPDERLTVMLRHFTRCTSYEAIARVTAVPVGTVRCRLNRARGRLAGALMATVAGTPLSHATLEAARRTQWEEFYRLVHQQPVPRTYQELFAPDVDVRDPSGHWSGIDAWSAEERDAITVGVHACIVGVLASSELTVLEIDFTIPATWPDHCPPQATFVHRLRKGRSRQLRIHYPGAD